MKKKILLIMLLTPIMMSCNNSHQGNVSDEEYEEAIITTPPAPDIATLRRNIREYGDTMSLEKYLMYYPEYLPTDNDSLLYQAL